MASRRFGSTTGAAGWLALAAWGAAAGVATGGTHVLPERPAIERRASPLGPLVTDFRAPAARPVPPPAGPARGTGCGRCGVAHAAHAACVGAYKAFNGWIETPYHDQNWIYGYYDYAWGRGPLITLGSRSMAPGFRGYGLFGSPGYGAGQRPVSAVDLEVLGGHWYPEARRLWPRWSHWPK